MIDILGVREFYGKEVMPMKRGCRREDDLKRNGEGYYDPTAYEALRNIERSVASEKEEARFHKLLHTIFYLCELAGFRIEGRLILRDEKTGRIWK